MGKVNSAQGTLKHPLCCSPAGDNREQLQTDVVSLVSLILSLSPKHQGPVPMERMMAARLKQVVF